MTPTITDEQIAKDLELCNAATAGPWMWSLNPASKQIDLSSREWVVMGFARWGMNGATPEFRSQRGLKKAEHFGQVIPGREHHAKWARALDHPDAEFITRARTLLPMYIAALRAERARANAAEAIVAKLPKTADGVAIYPAMHVWFYSPNSMSQSVSEFKVTGWEYLPGMQTGYMFVVNVCDEHGESDGVNLACCYSTREAAASALAKTDKE